MKKRMIFLKNYLRKNKWIRILNLKGNGFEINYNYYKKEDNIIIRIEAAGNYNIIPSISYAG